MGPDLARRRKSQTRRRPGTQRATRVDQPTSSAWDWSFETEGALALDRHELWEVPQRTSRVRVSQSPVPRPDLKAEPTSATVPPMPPRRARRQTVQMRQRRARARRIRRIVGLGFLAVVLLVTLLLTAFGTGQSKAPAAPARAAHAIPAGPPRPEVVAMQGSLPLQLPVQQAGVTAIGFHAPSDGALALEPLGHKANQGFLSRLFHRVFGGGGSKVRYYQLSGGSGPGTGSLDVGAPAGTDVYSPVDGTVVSVDDFVLNGEQYGSRIAIEPASAPSLLVSVTRLRVDPNLGIGSTVSAASSKLGVMLDLSHVEHQELSRYSHDAGNHVSIEVHSAPAPSLP